MTSDWLERGGRTYEVEHEPCNVPDAKDDYCSGCGEQFGDDTAEGVVDITISRAGTEYGSASAHNDQTCIAKAISGATV